MPNKVYRCPLCDFDTGPIFAPYNGGSKAEEIFIHVYMDHSDKKEIFQGRSILYGGKWCPCGQSCPLYFDFVGHIIGTKQYPGLGLKRKHVRMLMLHVHDALMGISQEVK